MRRIILCSAMPRSMMSDCGDFSDMNQYISLSISQNATVLSPTSAYTFNTDALMRIVLYPLEDAQCDKGKKVADTRLPSVGFRSRSRLLAVSLQLPPRYYDR